MNSINKNFILILSGFLSLSSYVFADDYKAKKTNVAPVIDGKETDICWSTAAWSPLNQIWVGPDQAPTPEDFTGEYKAVWTEEKLYILLKVTDDVLNNWNPTEPLKEYWNNDCPEIFIDENRSKGEHSCNYNAFAYHVSTLFEAVDSDADCKAQIFSDVLTGKRFKDGNTYTWEFEMNVFTDQYKLNAVANPKAKLVEGKIMGFSMAYNDSDQNRVREKMYGSQVINAKDKNVSYLNADSLGTMELVGNITDVVNTLDAQKSYKIYPNPATEIINITSSASVKQYNIYNSTGIKISEHTVQNNTDVQFDVSTFQKGIYFLHLISDNGNNVEIISIK